MNIKKILIPCLLLTALSISAAPIPFRGVVEGYYGRPWGTEGRLSLLKFMGENGMNTFIYGPKDDPYHHGKWRDLYPDDQAADFRKLLKVAKENHIHFYWAIHLGGAFNGSERDYAALFAKFDAMYALGFRAFAAFFDDFGGSDAAGHAMICNRILRDFLAKKGDCAPLIMCPNIYWGTGSRYQIELGRQLDPKIHIMWTGRGICSDIRRDAVEQVTKDLRRPPFIWWNWPVNDYCRSKLLLGRTYGCDNCEFAGFVSNPMENCEANKIALYGVAAWSRDPEHFDSEATWNEAFEKLYSPKVGAAMKVLATHNSDQGPNGHGYRREESVGVTDWKQELKRIHNAVKTLKAELPKENPRLLWEIEGWLDVQDLQAAIGRLAFKLAETKELPVRKGIVRKIIALRKAQAEAGERHREKFAAATFGGDKGHIRAPETATTVLEPLIRKMIADELNLDPEPPRAFSSVAALKNPTATREGKYIRFQKVLEQTSVKPGEAFGIVAPKTVNVDYFHAKLDTPAAAEHGRIELSKDFGATWSPLKTKNEGGEMQSRLNPNDGWNAARYINTSKEAVVLKVNEFKFDVNSDKEQVLLEEYVK